MKKIVQTLLVVGFSALLLVSVNGNSIIEIGPTDVNIHLDKLLDLPNQHNPVNS